MRFEWDDVKNRKNLGKRGISFELAAQAFSDPFCLTISDTEDAVGQRYWTIGRVETLTVVLVVHTTRHEDGEEIFRIISARRATRKERRIYEEVDG